MAKINIVLADSDELYLQQLTNYLLKNAGTFEVYSFTAKETLATHLSDKSHKIDILAFSEDLMDEFIEEANATVKLVISDGSFSSIPDYDAVNKYQKTDKLMNDLLMAFAEKSGRVEVVSLGDKETKIVGFYSPVGGSGKTTIALSSAYALAMQGKKVFYLNAEKINSTVDVLNQTTQGSLSDLYLILKTKGANIGLKIMANKVTDSESNISYISPAESSLEINELTVDELKKLIGEFEHLGEFDIVVIDFDSDLSKEKISLIDKCDRIIAPFTDDALSLSKIKLYAKELSIHDELEDIKNKTIFVLNKATPQSNAILQNSGLYDALEPKSIIALSPMFSDIKNVFQSGNNIIAALSKVCEYI